MPAVETSGLPSRISFAAACVVAGLLFNQAITSPHPVAGAQTVRDTFTLLSGQDAVRAFRAVMLLLCLGQSTLVLLQRRLDPARARPLNPTLLSWNLLSVLAMLTIAIPCTVRLRAFADLGTDFTFQLREPDRLNTSGLYAYVQHPSYITLYVALIASVAWFARCDGVSALVLPRWILKDQRMWNRLILGGFAVAAAVVAWVRIREEEALLRRKFGKEWADWNARTARLIPGVF